jgi:hypothetical protein
MAGHSRSKIGVDSARLCPAIYVLFFVPLPQDVDARHKAGHDENPGWRSPAYAAATSRLLSFSHVD